MIRLFYCGAAAMGGEDAATVLAKLRGRRVAVVCVGNALRADDGFGEAVAAELEPERLAGRVFDGGSVPEDVLPKVARSGAEVVLFVDAADWGGAAGTLRVVSPEELAEGGFSTHSGSLGMSAEFLRELCGAESMLLAVQAKSTEFGGVMCREVIEAAQKAAGMIRKLL